MKTVTAGILIHKGAIFIARRKPGLRFAHKWEFPGGKTERGETPEQCLKREMEEEFGIDVSVGEFLGESIHQYDHGGIRLLAYRIYWAGGEMELRDHEECRWVSTDELGEYDFTAADFPFVERLRRGEIGL
jgi:8-oxo-dGTP diphosphatase